MKAGSYLAGRTYFTNDISSFGVTQLLCHGNTFACWHNCATTSTATTLISWVTDTYFCFFEALLDNMSFYPAVSAKSPPIIWTTVWKLTWSSVGGRAACYGSHSAAFLLFRALLLFLESEFEYLVQHQCSRPVRFKLVFHDIKIFRHSRKTSVLFYTV